MSVKAERQAVIDHAFNSFVRDDTESIEAADLKGAYAANLHPKVISGELSEDEVFLEFLTHFSDKNRDGRIHREEWNAYYGKISASIDVDSHFCQLMAQVWRL